MISSQAIIDSNAELSTDVVIEPFAIIGKNVKIDSGTWVGPHVVINGPTRIGKNNKIYQFSSIGVECQDKKYNGEPTTLEIGDNNIFRESCTVHRGTVNGRNRTLIGHNNLFMTNTHVAHDCIVENNTILSHGASLAGHVVVQSHVNLSGFVGVNQFCNIGPYSFAAGGSMIIKDVMPYVLVAGHPAKVCGVNVIGLERNNFSIEDIAIIKQAYKIIFISSKTVADAIDKLLPLVDRCSHIKLFINFLKQSKRGILR
jgi:UDP-N-acetylglucosamine acyltransferase